ncbi:MAG: hypothetical protein CVU35_00420 [Betaproteobacteria bacterium HGW-Betaproteobacteria-8]|nr:MAG: hypothetical protein CVU35_00420 [Betaproteobacteria bacterium HGW-Betaproteobacteria-8]
MRRLQPLSRLQQGGKGMSTEQDRQFLQLCGADSVAYGGGSFAAMVVRDGETIIRSGNRVTNNCNPTTTSRCRSCTRPLPEKLPANRFQHQPIPESPAPFDAWLAKKDRLPY